MSSLESLESKQEKGEAPWVPVAKNESGQPGRLENGGKCALRRTKAIMKRLFYVRQAAGRKRRPFTIGRMKKGKYETSGTGFAMQRQTFMLGISMLVLTVCIMQA